MLIRAKAPLRVSFAGGGTDVPPFPEREGGLVLNATINKFVHGTLRPRSDKQIQIESVDYGMAVTYGMDDVPIFDGKLDLAKAAIRRLGVGGTGVDVFLHSGAPPGSGLGSSSTVVVTVIGLLKELGNLPLTNYEIAQHAYVIERDDLGIQGGLQDQYAATFGGFNLIEFSAEHVLVVPLRIAPDTINELEHNFLLCFTGKTRRSDQIIEDQRSRVEARDPHALEGLRTQKQLALDMKDALLRHKPQLFGELLDAAWQEKKKMSDRISVPIVEEMYEEARRHGAVGGKLVGAGGGGYMLFYCNFERKHKVAAALIRMGGMITDFAFEASGLQTWRIPE